MQFLLRMIDGAYVHTQGLLPRAAWVRVKNRVEWFLKTKIGHKSGGRIIDNLQIYNLQIDNLQIDNRQIDNHNLQIDNWQIW